MRGFAQPRGTLGKHVQFGFAFEIEHQNTGAKRGIHFLRRFADAGKHDAAARPAIGNQHPLKFAAGNNIKAGSKLRKQAKNREIGVGLHRVAEGVRMAGESRIQCLKALLDGGCRVDVKRGAEFFGERTNRDSLAVQFVRTALSQCAIEECRRTARELAMGRRVLLQPCSSRKIEGICEFISFHP